MSDHTIEQTPLTLVERMVQAGSQIVSLHTGLPLELSQHILDKSIRRASSDFGIVAYDTEKLSPHEKLDIAKRAIAFIGDDLGGRGISPDSISDVQSDLETFYRGVRGIPPSGGN